MEAGSKRKIIDLIMEDKRQILSMSKPNPLLPKFLLDNSPHFGVHEIAHYYMKRLASFQKLVGT